MKIVSGLKVEMEGYERKMSTRQSLV